MEEKIISTANPRIKNAIKLKEKASERKLQDLIVVEGFREITMAIANGYAIKTLFLCEDIATKNIREMLGSVSHLVRINKAVFEKMAYRENSDGLLALVQPKHLRLKDIKLSVNPLILVLDAVEKPGNLGAILRTADGCATDAVVICNERTDVFNPNVIRSSIGCVFSKQVVACSFNEAVDFLKDKKIKIFAASLNAHKNYSSCNFQEGVALVMGTEASGLSDDWMRTADEQIKIPMLGMTDSLNVSTSCAVLAYEVLRQRTIQK